jgi:transcriptional regulator with XRE-family HTH domain
VNEEAYKKAIGRRLRIAVEDVQARDGVSQVEVARQMQISPQRLGNYFRGEHYPNPYHLRLFCRFANISFDLIYR